jgi:hypothetical protein
MRSRIDTVFGQLVDRFAVKRVWARDLWHLSSRLLRTVLMQTLAASSSVHVATHRCSLPSWWPDTTCTSG